MIDAFDGSATVTPSPNPDQSVPRAVTEDNAPSYCPACAGDEVGVTTHQRHTCGEPWTSNPASGDNAPSIERVRKIAFDLFYEMDDLEGPNQDKFCLALAQTLFDAGLLRTGRHAEVLRQLDRAESRYNTLRAGVEKLRDDPDASSVPTSYLIRSLGALLSKDGNDGS